MTSDQIRQPGMNRTCMRCPGRLLNRITGRFYPAQMTPTAQRDSGMAVYAAQMIPGGSDLR